MNTEDRVSLPRRILRWLFWRIYNPLMRLKTAYLLKLRAAESWLRGWRIVSGVPVNPLVTVLGCCRQEAVQHRFRVTRILKDLTYCHYTKEMRRVIDHLQSGSPTLGGEGYRSTIEGDDKALWRGLEKEFKYGWHDGQGKAAHMPAGPRHENIHPDHWRFRI